MERELGLEYNSDDDDFGLGAAEKNMNFRQDVDKQSEDKFSVQAQQLANKRVCNAVYARGTCVDEGVHVIFGCCRLHGFCAVCSYCVYILNSALKLH